jgi:hypothetical protein
VAKTDFSQTRVVILVFDFDEFSAERVLKSLSHLSDTFIYTG